jgi:L-lactate dehydrogenase complex protein LldG
MAADALATFGASLDRLDVGWTQVAPDEFDDALASVAGDPAVGVRLPFASVSLPEWVDSDLTPASLEAAHTGVSPARVAVADYGSVVLQASAEGAEQVGLFVDRHVPVVRAADVVPTMAEAIERLGPAVREERSSHVVATGPSATADMGELVRGAHGPKEVHVLVVDDRTEGEGT